MLARFSKWLYERTHPKMLASNVNLLATLIPSFEHFDRFQNDPRVGGIRINPPMITPEELERDFSGINVTDSPTPLWYDVKGRQLRVEEVIKTDGRLELVMNHSIRMELTSNPVSRGIVFKAGADDGLIERIEDDGRRIILMDGKTYGPRWQVKPGESIHLYNPTLEIRDPLFTEVELGKIETAKRAGFKRWFLSYVEEPQDIDRLRELIGPDQEIWLKIESKRGLEFVRRDFRKREGLVLTAARGDLYMELEKPHQIADALRLIIEKDSEACVGSRILLSVAQRPMPPELKEKVLKEVYERASWKSFEMEALREFLGTTFHDPIPSCADFSELAWLLDLGYRNFLLCDELCLKEELLATAINAFWEFVLSYQLS